MGCSESTRACLKFTIVFFNIPIIVIGAVSLGIGVWVTVDDNSFFDLTASILDLQVLGQDILRQGALVMIVAGAAMIILAGIGVIGALAMSSCILTFYAVVLILLLVLEVAVIILGIVFKSEWEAKSSMLVLSKLKTQYGYNDSDSRAPLTRTYDALQKKLHCCGWEGGPDFANATVTNWNNATLPNGLKRTVPDSCCIAAPNVTQLTECTTSPYNNTFYYTQGCRKVIESKLRTYQWVVIGVTIAVLTFQFLIIVLTLSLVVHNVNNKYDMS
ncbi:CD82 antigen [Biomphalaria pfeifferi]|uniref:Tetraspanin n=1 Tax=Biomphalaria pfeifferi TaxID=112525 RepID=A0AAD8C645_BIOPF|nr:CD82 antigen [Biomphalaria pfeifferi]